MRLSKNLKARIFKNIITVVCSGATNCPSLKRCIGDFGNSKNHHWDSVK